MSSSLCTVCDAISSTVAEVLSINSSANIFVFGDFSVLYKEWLTYSGGTYRYDSHNLQRTTIIATAIRLNKKINSLVSFKQNIKLWKDPKYPIQVCKT